MAADQRGFAGSRRDLQQAGGLDPAFVSKLAGGKVNKLGVNVVDAPWW